MRSKATALILAVTALLPACVDPVEPRVHDVSATVSLASESATEIAYHSCYQYWDPDAGDIVVCSLTVLYADGYARVVASGEDLIINGPHRATWSPDASRIAFANGMGDVSVVTIANWGLVNLTNHPASDESPSWSPDGARIVFQSNRDGAPELYLMNADGSNVVRLTYGVGVYTNGGHPSHPTWSPDGMRVVFTCGGTGKPEICVINANGTGFTHLTNDPNSSAFDPDWSPDGARIAFASQRRTAAGYWESSAIAVINADGGSATWLTDPSSDHEPDWSPDGSRIMFSRGPGGCDAYGICDGNIYLMNADGSAQQPLQFPTYGHGAAWAPVSPPLPPADQPPVASFTYGCNQLVCTFDSSLSHDDGGIVSWSWSLGDGQVSTAASPLHTYAAPGTYVVTLTVVDGSGFADSQTKSVTPDAPPEARFGASCVDLTCTFDGRQSTDDYGIASWRWNFGDGQSSTSPNPAHSYAAGGTYTVTLTVTDGSGSTDSHTSTVTVIAPIQLSATVSRNGVATVNLSWTGASGANVDVFRNNVYLTTTPNDGAYSDTFGRAAKGKFTYRVCNSGTTICSLPVTVTF